MDRAEVVTTNQKIALHAKRKELALALGLFESLRASEATNSHSYGAIVNACVQCGDMTTAEQIIAQMVKDGRKLHRDVVTCTTLMKGYCNASSLVKAIKLFKEMVQRNAATNKPNIRTVNTILRGCVQAGAVQEAEDIFTSLPTLALAPDVSAWEYLITLQCQNLSIDKVMPTLGRIKADPMMQSGLLRIYLNLSRAAALLGECKTARKFLKQAEETSQVSTSQEDAGDLTDLLGMAEADALTNAKKAITGGKRAWKSLTSNSLESTDEARNQSLVLYRQHIGQEADADLQLIRKYLDSSSSAGTGVLSASSALDHLLDHLQRFISLSTDSLDTVTDKHTLGQVVMDALQERFGLQAMIRRIAKKSIAQLLNDRRLALARIEKGGQDAVPITADQQVADKLQALQDRVLGYFGEDGHLDFDRVFMTENIVKKPLKLEVCSGSGEWACAQAEHDPNSRWMTLEVRQDRVYNTFCRAVMQRIGNVAVLGGDAMQLLPKHFPSACLQQVCVNYPEPPQQRADQDYSEAKHLLNEAFFLEAWRVLQPGGLLTILTDNLWYGKLVARILSEQKGPTWRSLVQKVNLVKGNGKKKYFDGEAAPEDTPVASATPWKAVQTSGSIVLYEGEPGAQAGHATQASSYFDRLWQRSEQKDRYFIALHKVGDTVASKAKAAVVKEDKKAVKPSVVPAAVEPEVKDDKQEQHPDRADKKAAKKGKTTVVPGPATSEDRENTSTAAPARPVVESNSTDFIADAAIKKLLMMSDAEDMEDEERPRLGKASKKRLRPAGGESSQQPEKKRRPALRRHAVN